MPVATNHFIDVLKAKGKLAPQDLEAAQAQQKTKKQPLEKILIESGKITKLDYLEAQAQGLGVDFIDIEKKKIEPEVLALIPESMSRRYNLVCVEKTGTDIKVAMADPSDIFASDDLKLRTGYSIVRLLAYHEDITAALDNFYRKEQLEGLLEEVTGGKLDFEKSEEDKAKEKEEAIVDAPIIKFVNHIITDAIGKKASDIHIEVFEYDVRVRLRMDGVLFETMKLPKNILPAVVSRIKILSNLDIAERRIPQDGRIKIKIKPSNREYDLRVSTLPTVYGESVVMRILDRSSIRVELKQLGFTPEDYKNYISVVEKPNGIIFVTGPTGSGKSTTLYATLNYLNQPGVKILTVEDPVEYNLAGINQVQVNPVAELTFASALRSFLRQDPDIIMVGEIRDKETATIAIESALTGHLVLSTLHTNDAVATIARLVDIGIEPFLLSSTINGVLAQRLVRTICKDCKEPWPDYPEEYREILRANGFNPDEITLYKGKGCDTCNQSGYKGRCGIYEIFTSNDDLKNHILKNDAPHVLRDVAMKYGLHSLFYDGVSKVAMGITTFDEVFRVTKT